LGRAPGRFGFCLIVNPLTFSTLACPEWSPETIIERAAAYGYDGIEWRGGEQGHIPPSLSAAACRALGKRVAAAGLFSLALTSYTSFTSPDPTIRAANAASLRQAIDQAHELEARFVRVFLGELPPGRTAAAAYPGILDSLAAAAEQARVAGVGLAIEPHDDFVRSETVAPVLAALPQLEIRVIWDVGNAYAAGELPAEAWARLGQRLAYVQVKDGTGQGEGWRLGPLGEGEVPLAGALALLRAGPAPFTGAISLEWERAWHPELDTAEVALPAARQALQRLLSASATLAASAWPLGS
jgi:sugar phosphate isomerase/epimerase